MPNDKNALDIRSFRWPIVGVSAVFFILSVYFIVTLPLWSHWPLVFLLSAWGLITGLQWNRLHRNIEASKRWTLSTLSGMLLAFSFPMSFLAPLIFVAFIPLLYLEWTLPQDHKRRFRILFGHTYNAFFLWNIIATFWVLNTSFIPGIAANTINTLIMTIPILLFAVIRRKFNFKVAYLSFIAFWMTFEYIHLGWEISWPWLNLGNTFAHIPQIVQWYEYTGCPGGALWILGINVLFFLRLRNKSDWRKTTLRDVAKPLLFIAIPIGISLVQYRTYKEVGTMVNVTVVQPNYEPHYQKFSVPQSIQINKMDELGRKGVTDKTQFLVYPETVLHQVRLSGIERNPGISKFRKIIKDYPQLAVVMGVSSIRTYPRGNKMNRATRTFINEQTGDTTFWDVQNAGVCLRGDEEAQVYFKSKLVPGAEIFPYREWLPFIEPIIAPLGGSSAGHLTQKERSVFQHGAFKIAPVICYESIYGAYVGEYIKNGAQAIFVMTNDGWWDNTSGHRQHLAFSRLRAIEHRKPVARSANTGISCFINARGDVISPSKYEEDAVINGSMAFNDVKTFYTLWGDYLSEAAVLVSLMFIFVFLAKVNWIKN